jgi:serine/threonine-protein kinase
MAESSPVDTDRNLLFGVLALQAALIDNDQFAQACAAWATRKQQPLAELLVERSWLTAEDRGEVERLLQRHLTRHGSSRASLAHLNPRRLRDSLAGVQDAELTQSLATLTPPAEPGPSATVDYVPESRERYSLTRLHAKGGIGQVWLAHDADLGRDVALKELRPDRRAQPEALARFLEEAQITGQLEHPGIVPVYELVRTGPDRKPFYTMRFLRGRTLSEAGKSYHQQRAAGAASRLALRELLNALVATCQAVAYAHSRGVLHRDLKGQNVVLGDFGEAVVLDWGLAKVGDDPDRTGSGEGDVTGMLPVAVEASDSREETLPGQVLGTPGYMAPEQAAGRRDLVGPRSDVYGLGAMLYEILTGQPPFRGSSREEVIRKVTSDPPLPPAALVPGTPAALQAICLKALAKQPAERYASAGDLARDLQRFLADEPVTAHRDAWPTRLARWGRRHRPLVTGAVALLVAAVVALTAGSVLLGQANAQIEHERQQATEQRDRANENFQKALQAVNDYFTTVSENRLLKGPLPGLQPLRKELLTTALTYYQDFARQHGEDPALQAELAAALRRLGTITAEIGSKEEALQALQNAVGLYEDLVRTRPGDFATRRGLAQSLEKLGDAQEPTGRGAEALQSYQKAIAIGEELAREQPDEDVLFDLASACNGLGKLQGFRGKPVEAGQAYGRASALLTRLVEQHPQTGKYRSLLAGVSNNIGMVQMYNLSQYEPAIGSFRRAIAMQEKLLSEDPNDVQAQNFLAVHYMQMANAYYYLRRQAECNEANQHMAQILDRLVRENPRVSRYRTGLAQGYVNLAQGHVQAGEVVTGLRIAQQAIDLMERSLRDFPEEPDFHYTLACAQEGYAGGLRVQGRYAEMIAPLQQAIVHQRQAVARSPEDMFYQQSLGWHYFHLAEAHIGMRQPAEALKAWQQTAAVWDECARTHPSDIGFLSRLPGKYLQMAEKQSAAGLHEAALQSRRRALEVAEQVVRAKPENPAFRQTLATSAHDLGEALVHQGRPLDALPPLQQALQEQQSLVERTPGAAPRRQLASMHSTYARAQVAANQRAGALRSLQAARAVLEKLPERGPNDHYSLACILAQASALGAADRAAADADQAVAALRQAVAAGYKDARRLAEDTNLDPLRSRKDFQELLAGLQKESKK